MVLLHDQGLHDLYSGETDSNCLLEMVMNAIGLINTSQVKTIKRDDDPVL